MATQISFATHIVGGEITYTKLTGNNYKVTLKLYRDCYNGVAPYDDPAYVFIFNSFGTLVQTLNLSFPGSVKLPIVLTTPCLVPPSNICVEEAVYTGNVNLPPVAGGYDLVYQRCCRNNTIINLINPGDVGSTYLAHIPGPEIVGKNSSPIYTHFPPLFLCVNTPIVFDHSATDADGDSLVYQLCDPFEGADTNCPQPGSNSSCPPSPPPPYNNVPWNTNYSGASPLNSSPVLSIDPKTGLLSGTPTMVGQFVVGVCVSEYRKGVFLSVNKRDFQFNVLACLNPIAAIPSQQVFCDGLSVNFLNYSINSTSFKWDFGDPNSGTSNFSTLKTPVHLFSDSGVYKVKLIAYNNTNNCTDTAYTTFKVYPLLQADFVAPADACFGNAYDFVAGGTFDNVANFQWNFGANAIPQQSSLQNPKGVQFTQSGNFPISLSITQYGCVKTVSKTFNIFPRPKSIISSANQFCSGLNLQFQNLSTNAISYLWDFGDTSVVTDQSTLLLPSYNYPDSGVYKVQLIAYSINNLCNDTLVQDFYVYPLIQPFFVAPNPQCFKNNSFQFKSGGVFTNFATFLWDFGPDGIPSQSAAQDPIDIKFLQAGSKTIKLTVSQFGCNKSYTDSIFIIHQPEPAIAIQSDPCIGMHIQFNNSSAYADSFYWNFGDMTTFLDTSFRFEPQYTFPDSGVYHISLKAYNSSGMCYDSVQSIFHVYPLLNPQISPIASECFENNHFDFLASGTYGSTATFFWNFSMHALPQNSILKNPQGIVYDSIGSFQVILNLTENGCSKTVSDSVHIFPMPKALFNAPPSEGCVPLAVQFKDSSKSATILNYLWTFGDGNLSSETNPIHIYDKAGIYDVSLSVISTNGCIDTSVFMLPNLVKAHALPIAGYLLDSLEKSSFEPSFDFYDISKGAVKCKLIFGDGDSSLRCNTLHTYPDTGTYQFTQIVSNIYGCSDTIRGKLRVRPEYRFFVPNAFTPNMDGINDEFRPLMMGVTKYNIYIFNRWGELIYQGDDQNKGWDGSLGGNPCQQDVYTYLIKLENVFEKKDSFIGSVSLIR